MRSSSMKSLTLVAALVVTLTAATRAEAKPAQKGGTIRGVKTTLTQLISRYLAKFRVEAGPPLSQGALTLSFLDADGKATNVMPSLNLAAVYKF